MIILYKQTVQTSIGDVVTLSPDPALVIFDMPSRFDDTDLGCIPSPLSEHLEACKRGLYNYPFDAYEALEQANEAKRLAIIMRRKDIERRIRFYMAECYRRMKYWDEAYKLYMECTVNKRYERLLWDVLDTCRDEILELRRRRIERLRRNKAEMSKPCKSLRRSHQEWNVRDHRKDYKKRQSICTLM